MDITASKKQSSKKALSYRILSDLFTNRYLYIMLLPVLAYYILFHYMPMYGAIIAFKDFSPAKGIVDSNWVGLKYFSEFFNSTFFVRLLRNTVLLSVYNLVYGFPAPLLLAILLNEIRNLIFKRTVQTITYLPHFISLVVICGIILDFTARDGVINSIIGMFGAEPIAFMRKAEWFRTIYVSTTIWQEIGWGSIVYLAALSGISQDLYEACRIDGGGRLRQAISITLPGIAPTTITLLILRVGRIMNIGYEKVILLYNASTYETADIISTYVYRKGLLEMSYSYSAAVGLFNSAINLMLLIAVNALSRKYSETSLW